MKKESVIPDLIRNLSAGENAELKVQNRELICKFADVPISKLGCHSELDSESARGKKVIIDFDN